MTRRYQFDRKVPVKIEGKVSMSQECAFMKEGKVPEESFCLKEMCLWVTGRLLYEGKGRCQQICQKVTCLKGSEGVSETERCL